MPLIKLVTFLGISYILSCTQAKSPSSSDAPHTDSIVKGSLVQNDTLAAEMTGKQIDYFIITVPNNQYGYYIMIDGQMYIEQKTIPAVEGTAGFTSQEDAEKVAKLVVEKIKQGILPPDVTIAELKELGIIE